MDIQFDTHFTKNAIKYSKHERPDAMDMFSRLNETNEKLTGTFCESRQNIIF